MRAPSRGLTVGTVVAVAAAGLALAASWPAGPDFIRFELPTSLEHSSSNGLGSTLASGLLRLTVTPSEVAFGSVGPGESSRPVTVTVTNGGAVPLALRLVASPLDHADGLAQIPATGVTVATAADVASVALDRDAALDGLTLAPGTPLQLHFQLHVPGGKAQWTPAGAYAGSITLTAEEVAP